MTGLLHTIRLKIPGSAPKRAIENYKAAMIEEYGPQAFNGNHSKRTCKMRPEPGTGKFIPADGWPKDGLSINDYISHMQKGTKIGLELIEVYSHIPVR